MTLDAVTGSECS